MFDEAFLSQREELPAALASVEQPGGKWMYGTSFVNRQRGATYAVTDEGEKFTCTVYNLKISWRCVHCRRVKNGSWVPVGGHFDHSEKCRELWKPEEALRYVHQWAALQVLALGDGTETEWAKFLVVMGMTRPTSVHWSNIRVFRDQIRQLKSQDHAGWRKMLQNCSERMAAVRAQNAAVAEREEREARILHGLSVSMAGELHHLNRQIQDQERALKMDQRRFRAEELTLKQDVADKQAALVLAVLTHESALMSNKAELLRKKQQCATLKKQREKLVKTSNGAGLFEEKQPAAKLQGQRENLLKTSNGGDQFSAKIVAVQPKFLPKCKTRIITNVDPHLQVTKL